MLTQALARKTCWGSPHDMSVSCNACSVKSAEIALELDKQMAESELLLGIAEKVRWWGRHDVSCG